MKEIRTIVIDPGHGGENLGTTSNNTFEEKEIAMLTAQTIYDELSQYDELNVYMTRTDDKDLSLKERAEFAASVNADMMFSIHYNASESHLMFGSEIWIPLDAPGNATGYRFGEIFLSKMQDMGLHIRGIKTRESEENPGTNYYGVIRESHNLGIPTVILEHCYVDAADDIPYIDSNEDIIAFGKADAQAIAEFLGLEPHAKEYESFDYPLDQVVSQSLKDATGPDFCEIDLLDADYEKGLLSIQVSAMDSESALIYYDYSLDGGDTFSHILPWPESNALEGTYADSFKLTIAVENQIPTVLVRAYSGFDEATKSNVLGDFDGVFKPSDAVVEEVVEVIETPAPTPEVQNTEEPILGEYETVAIVPQDDTHEFTTAQTFIIISLFVTVIIFCASIVMMMLEKRQKRRRRKKK